MGVEGAEEEPFFLRYLKGGWCSRLGSGSQAGLMAHGRMGAARLQHCVRQKNTAVVQIGAFAIPECKLSAGELR